jgi:hypothetical protein
MAKLRLDDDFRTALEAAVAYRMTEMFNNLPAEEARKRVHDVAIKGHNSDYSHQVVAAGYDLFQPTISAALPALRLILQQLVVDVKMQIDRGQRAEEATEG